MTPPSKPPRGRHIPRYEEEDQHIRQVTHGRRHFQQRVTSHYRVLPTVENRIGGVVEGPCGSVRRTECSLKAMFRRTDLSLVEALLSISCYARIHAALQPKGFDLPARPLPSAYLTAHAVVRDISCDQCRVSHPHRAIEIKNPATADAGRISDDTR